MSIIQAILLGLIQGLTEFLPVSSSGHIELGKAILGIELEDDLTFSLLVHAATVLSILIVFRADILNLISKTFTTEWNSEKGFIAKLAISMIPVGIVGLLFEDQVEALFSGNLILVGFCLMATAGILLLTRLERKDSGAISWTAAIVVGIAQAIAILPGISRSGTTISTALALGANREEATRFSFLMVLAPILGATVLKIGDLGGSAQLSTELLSAYAAGFIAALVSGYAACTWMLHLVKKGKLIYFSIYCFLAGMVAVFFSL